MIKDELKGRTIYILGLMSVALLFLAYQVKTPFKIDLGEPGDSPYIDGFWDPEKAGDASFRWSSHSSSVFIPGIGGYAPALLRLRLNGFRPKGLPAPRVTLRINGQELLSFFATDEFETYEFTVGRQKIGISGNLEVEIDSDFFVPDQVDGGGDLRQLGVLIDSLSVEFQGTPASIVMPAPFQMICLLGAVLAFYLLVRWVLPERGAVALATLILIGLSLAIAIKRVYLAPYAFWVLVIPGLSALTMQIARPRPATAKGLVLATALASAAALGLKRLASVASLVGIGIAPDLANNYAAATILRSGGMIYDIDKPLFVGYDNPPITAILTMPLTLLDLRTAITLFFSVNFIFLLMSLTIVYVARRDYLLRYPYWLIALALVVNLDPVQDSLLLGQLDLLILLLIVISYWAFTNSQDILAGCSLGLAAMIKLSPVLLILYFLLKREFRVFASALLTGLLVGALSLFFAGIETHILFVTGIVPTLLAGSAQMENQSLNGFFNRLFLGPSFTTSLAEVPGLPQVRLLTLLASLLLVGTAAFLVRKKIVSRNDLHFDLEFSLVVISLPLISSIAWHHYMTWYVLPFLLLLNPTLRSWVSKRKCLLLGCVVLLFYATLCIPITSYAANFLEGAAELILSVRLYGALAFYGIFAYLLTQYPRSESQLDG